MTVGSEIRKAFAFVRDVQNDSKTMLLALERELIQLQVFPIQKEPEAQENVTYAGYSKATSKQPGHELRGVEVQLLPAFADEAVLVLFRAEFIDEKLPGDMYKAWADVGYELGTRLVVGETVTFLDEEAGSAVKGVRRLIVHTMPLSEVPDKRAVRDVLATRLTAL